MKKIVGYQKELAELSALTQMLLNAEEYRKRGVRIPRGLLLSGDPGVGKTQMARAMAVKGIRLIELPVATATEEIGQMIEEAFDLARRQAPAILLLDELDKYCGGSPSFFMEDNDVMNKALLRQLDALTPEDNVLVVATCNDPLCMGPALTRPGRFDRQMHVALPDEDTRLQILRHYFRKIRVEKEFSMQNLAKNTRGFTPARLECLANESGIAALAKEKPVITEQDLRRVINQLEFGAAEKDPFDDFESLHRVAVHEAGHAFAALYLCPESLFGATVMPQGESNGHIRFVPEENRVQTVEEIETEAAVLMAGHVAERVIMGSYLVGAAEDMEGATMRLHYLATREAAYGYDLVLAGMGRGRFELAGEFTKNRAAALVEKKLLGLDHRIQQLIYDHPEVYAAICHALEEKRVLSREELLKIKEQATEAPAA